MLDDWVFTTDYSKELLLNQFHTKSLKGFGIHELETATISAGASTPLFKGNTSSSDSAYKENQ